MVLTVTSPNKPYREYTEIKELGQGSFGIVFLTEDKSGNKYAAKVMFLPEIPKDPSDPKYEESKAQKDAILTDFNREAQAQLKLSAEPQCQTNIVCLYEYFVTDRAAIMIFELMDGDLEHLPPSDELFVPMTRSLLESLIFIHGKGFAHRDIKEGNILRKGDVFKIGDLGLVCGKGGQKDIPICYYGAGTPMFMSPYNVGNPNVYDTLENHQKEDVWALAVVLYELLYGKYPFAHLIDETDPTWQEKFMSSMSRLDQSQIDRAFAQVSPRDPLKIPVDELANLIYFMMKVNPKERPTAQRALDYLNLIVPPISRNSSIQQDIIGSQEAVRNVESSLLNKDQLYDYAQNIRVLMDRDQLDEKYLRDILNIYQRDYAIRSKLPNQDEMLSYVKGSISNLQALLNDMGVVTR